MVPHHLLLCKLEELGVDHYLLRWICNYLLERKQQVVVDGAISGVPQGSVLVPLLFLIYIDGFKLATQMEPLYYMLMTWFFIERGGLFCG